MAKEVNKENKKDKKSFFKEFKAELKRVNWPTFKQLVNNTTAVLIIVLIVAVIVFVLDVIFENLNNYGIDKLKLLVRSSTTDELNEDEQNDIDFPGFEFETDEDSENNAGNESDSENDVEGEAEVTDENASDEDNNQ